MLCGVITSLFAVRFSKDMYLSIMGHCRARSLGQIEGNTCMPFYTNDLNIDIKSVTLGLKVYFVSKNIFLLKAILSVGGLENVSCSFLSRFYLNFVTIYVYIHCFDKPVAHFHNQWVTSKH